MSNSQSDAHEARIDDQFTRQAADFAAAPELHNDDVLRLLIAEAAPRATDETLDVACGPGSVAVAFAKIVRHATGLDATAAMLAQAEVLAAGQGRKNVSWRQGDVYALPFADASFDIVTCRFAFHHLQDPMAAFREMVRVCRPGGRVVLCDGIVVDDPVKAAAFNRMEIYRDPSTVAFRPLGALTGLFAVLGLPAPAQKFFQVPAEREQTILRAFPEGDDRDGLRRLINAAVEGDAWGVGARRSFDTVLFAYPSVILTAAKPIS
jgi:ubiquinone/menaquinone biosynthesis C-methylase UbiE